MTGAELAAALGGLLFLSFAAGWGAHWLWSRAAAVSAPRQDRADELAAELLVVEAARDAALAEAAAREAALREEALSVRSSAEATAREREAEMEALSAGLRAAREEIATLRGR